MQNQFAFYWYNGIFFEFISSSSSTNLLFAQKSDIVYLFWFSCSYVSRFCLVCSSRVSFIWVFVISQLICDITIEYLIGLLIWGKLFWSHNWFVTSQLICDITIDLGKIDLWYHNWFVISQLICDITIKFLEIVFSL